ncbi:MAG: sugar transferase [Lachnospiraceae bacterium]
MLCAFAIVVLSPVYLLTAIGIKISSPGTVLYHSMRAGLNKRPFKFCMFRSMHPSRSKKKDMFVINPDRLFLFGRLIRRLT